ncbi:MULTISPECIES: 3-hydroxyacyl-ACP dehydratase FabZ family protein [unclassified Streptomyces]|uniref:3-hydroxyacyl-ACP dehydratase FabZ family protein n=1 Tax=unclassified Streptomyces TaxID=2593676 RepID=UPI00378CEE51
MIDAAGIKSMLPHRYPMLLVDRVLELVPGDRLTALKAVTCNEPWYRDLPEGARTEQFAYPQTLLVESWGQAAGLLAVHDAELGEGAAGQVMLAGAMSGVEFLRPVYPGDVLVHQVRLYRALTDTVIFDGETLVDGEPAMTFSRMVMAFRPAEQLRPAGTPVADPSAVP